MKVSKLSIFMSFLGNTQVVKLNEKNPAEITLSKEN